MTMESKPKGRPCRIPDGGTIPDSRKDKSLRVLRVLAEHQEPKSDRECLNRERLAACAQVTVRNLDAILKSLREQGHDILWDECYGYQLMEPCEDTFRVRAPENYLSLRSLRSYLEAHAELVERDKWVRILDEIIANSEKSRKKQMGRDFEEALVDGEGRMYRVAEPEIFYLNVHRPRPESLTRIHVERLREAIRGCHPVRIHYVNREGEKDIIQVDPYFVFYREGTFYLAGVQTHSSGQPMKAVRFKPFTITSMRCPSLDVLRDKTFAPLARYSAVNRLTRTGIRSEGGEAPVQAEFDVHGKFAYNACETEHGESSKHEWLRTGRGTQHLRMKATFGSRYDLVRYVLSFGCFAELRSPEDVRSMIIANIKGMADRYDLVID